MELSNNEQAKDWLAQLRLGQAAGLEALFRCYHTTLCRTALRIVNDPLAAEDIVQDFFLQLWQKHSNISEIDQVEAYLKRSVRNRSLNYLRDQQRIPQGEDDFPDLPLTDNSAAVELELAELQNKVDQAIDALPERCRLVFVLKQFEEMTYKEIAEQLDISPKTVENQMARAYKLLRDHFFKQSAK